MTSWTDKAGRTLEVVPACESGPGCLMVAPAGAGSRSSVAFWLDGSNDLAEIAVALLTVDGQSVRVITPGPDVDPRLDYRFGPLTVRPPRGGSVPVEMGAVTEGFAPHVARKLAGVLVARADEADGQEPDPAERLAERLLSLSRLGLSVDQVAERLIADGWKREAGDA